MGSKQLKRVNEIGFPKDIIFQKSNEFLSTELVQEVRVLITKVNTTHPCSLTTAIIVIQLLSLEKLYVARKLQSHIEWQCMYAFRISTLHVTAPQDQDQDSLLVKRRKDNHSPGPVIRELVPSSHQRSELSNTILCIFSG